MNYIFCGDGLIVLVGFIGWIGLFGWIELIDISCARFARKHALTAFSSFRGFFVGATVVNVLIV